MTTIDHTIEIPNDDGVIIEQIDVEVTVSYDDEHDVIELHGLTRNEVDLSNPYAKDSKAGEYETLLWNLVQDELLRLSHLQERAHYAIQQEAA